MAKTDISPNPELKYEGKSIILPGEPKPMTIPKAIAWLQRIAEEENTRVTVHEDVDAYPWDGALAFQSAAKEMFGSIATHDAHMVSVPIGPNARVSVPWGSFMLPDIDGRIQCSFSTNPAGARIFQLEAYVYKRDVAKVRALAELVRQHARENSIYRGKAVRFEDDNIPPQYLDLDGVKAEELQFSTTVQAQLDTTLYAPLRHREWLEVLGVPFKRGVCLCGPYGVGKTLALYIAAQEATARSITFVLADSPASLEGAITFARQYAPAVVACEDIDQATSKRDGRCESIMEALDGIEAKSQQIMVVLSTNHVEKIHEAMRRPGRIDQFVRLDPPDAETITRLMMQYGRGLVEPDADLMDVAGSLVGHIPAEIREVVELAKLAAISRLGADGYDFDAALMLTAEDLMLTAEDLMVSAQYLLRRDEMFNGHVDASTESLKQMAVFGAKLVTSIVDTALVPSLAGKGNGLVQLQYREQ